MLYRKVSKTGDELSILGFGCMRLAQKKGKPGTGRIDEEKATRQLRYAIDCGVNYLDTAKFYHGGASEPFLGRALAGGYRDKVRLATKLPPYLVRTRGDIDKVLRTQLDSLKTDRIDYYLLHALDGSNWKRMKDLGVLDFLEKAKQDGRIGNAGFSFHGDRDSFKEIVDSFDWDICQIQYNFLDEYHQAGTEGLKYAAAKGLGVVVMEPLRGGNLAKELPVADAIWSEAQARRSPAEWALRWVWNHPEVTVVLSGMNDEKHIEENLRIAAAAYPESLTEAELHLVSRVEKAYREVMKVGCTGCQYCMPCPSGVDIPTCFEFYNSVRISGDSRWGKLNYILRASGFGGNPRYASLCQDCGKCADRCPQHLPVPELLRDVVDEFERWWFKPAIWALERVATLQHWDVARKARRIEKRNSR